MAPSPDETGTVFAFGQPVLRRPASRAASSKVYLLGAYPSGLHVAWTPPSIGGQRLRRTPALIVDNEPEPFWTGENADARFESWRDAVGWQPEWGTVTAAAGNLNGPSGRWVDEHVLSPLDLTRDEVCISDCLDTARLNAGQARVVAEQYDAIRGEVGGLPACTLRPVPRGEAGIVAEARAGHLDRLRRELAASGAERIVTLGNAALRVVAALAEGSTGLPARLEQETYGRSFPVVVDGRPAELLPLVHPRSGERTGTWPATHAGWASG